MNQKELIEKIKSAFEKVHKKVGVFQTGELDEIFEEDEEEERENEGDEPAIKFPALDGDKTEEKKLGDVPLIKEAIASTKLDGKTQTGDDLNGK